MSPPKRVGQDDGSAQAPKILLVSAFRWISLARTAIAFHEAGFAVSVLVPKGHPVEKLSFVTSIHAFNVFSAETSILQALKKAEPAILVPFDDIVVPILHGLHTKFGAESNIGALIEHSLGSPAFYPVIQSRLEFAKRLSALSIASPQTYGLRSAEDLRGAVEKLGTPVVLKSDGSWGGLGVAIVPTPDGLRLEFGKLTAHHNVFRAVKRAVFNRDFTMLNGMFRRKVKSVVAQQFLPGRPANAAVACWRGEVLASVNLEVIQSAGETGPATVVRHIDSLAMTQAIKAIVRDLKLSGICGFDFILSGPENQAQMIEMNPRSVPTVHLVNDLGQSLCHLLFEKVTGLAGPLVKMVPQLDVIALFPQEALRDPESPYLSYCYHDVPMHWPEYVELATGKSAVHRPTPMGLPHKV